MYVIPETKALRAVVYSAHLRILIQPLVKMGERLDLFADFLPTG